MNEFKSSDTMFSFSDAMFSFSDAMFSFSDTMFSFSDKAPCADAMFYRSYSRVVGGKKEKFYQMCDRTIKGLVELGHLDVQEAYLIDRLQRELITTSSGRWMWVGGTNWSKQLSNIPGNYNCSSQKITTWHSVASMMDVSMQGAGAGCSLELEYITALPTILHKLDVSILGNYGDVPSKNRKEHSDLVIIDNSSMRLIVGDSRQGWIEAYKYIFEIASHTMREPTEINLQVDISNVRPAGEPLRGFGGTSNPSMLADLFTKIAKILNAATGRQLNSLEICCCIDEASLVVVVGNVRRSSGIRQFSANDDLAQTAKDNLWVQDDKGNWSIDPERDCLRMANHTRVFHKKPSYDDILNAVTKQYQSGEGAIQWAGEAVARSNADLLNTVERKTDFLYAYSLSRDIAKEYLRDLGVDDNVELDHRMSRYLLNPCLAAGTMVMTREGHFPIEDLVGETVEVWDGNQWVLIDNFRITAENQPVFAVKLQNGQEIVATDYHSFVLADGSRKMTKELLVGDKLLIHNVIVDNHVPMTTGFIVESVKFSHIADKVYCCTVDTNHQFSLTNGTTIGNCGEIIQSESFCNLSAIHANNLDPLDFRQIDDAFKAGGLIVSSLLHHQFEDDRFQQSRELDPVVGVSVTGIFDFFVNLFGVDWLMWWSDGRPEFWDTDRDKARAIIDKVYDACAKFNVSLGNQTWQYSSDMAVIYTEIEQFYLSYWKTIVFDTVTAYCHKHNLKVPNRCTTVQPHGSVALLTNASPGWHPPKAQRYIRRMTFKRSDPVALACIDVGYNVIPSQHDKDENNQLLNDPYDDRCTEWLVEFPVEMSWANLPGVDSIDISKFPIDAQYSFYMQVQKHYVTHNTSATLMLQEKEIETLSKLIYKSINTNEGYISAAILATSGDTFPRMPFEPIDKQTYQKLCAEVKSRSKDISFAEALDSHWTSPVDTIAPAGCDSDKCTLSAKHK
jgi:hypothetical protein